MEWVKVVDLCLFGDFYLCFPRGNGGAKGSLDVLRRLFEIRRPLGFEAELLGGLPFQLWVIGTWVVQVGDLKAGKLYLFLS